eukprot:TRINITY_DN9772_c0_g1_i1.p1 TRINITY_DN9772_c0_g1~~TRINITY_DN9772_c0_g1_i1.p1  ORF type:complete len:377 (-),score=103.05 TRINITY_DN9772_c0_g1_i1:50-1045(-)
MSQENFAWEEIRIPEQKEFDAVLFPLVLAPKESNRSRPLEFWLEQLATHKQYLAERCVQHGTIVFRGFPVVTAADFDAFVKARDFKGMEYIGGAAPRRNIVGGVFTTNESPPHLFINFHHEMAQNPKFPSHLFFFCERPPAEGGQTPLVLSNQVYQRMKAKFPEFVAKLESTGVRYTRYLGNGDDHTSTIGRGWQSTWLTQDKEEAERKCRALGGNFEWQPNGSMKLQSTVLSAVREDPRNGMKRWFNQLGVAHPEHGWNDSLNKPSHACMFADGTPLPPEPLRWMLTMMDEIAVDVTWQTGDVMHCDNLVVLHGRRPFSGPRSILAWLAE